MFRRTRGSGLALSPRRRFTHVVRPRLELLEDRYAPAAGPLINATAPNPTNKPLAPLSLVGVQFDLIMDTTTFTVADIVSFTGPNGPITVTNVQPRPGFGNRVFDITFPAQTAAGAYSYSFGPDIRDTTGRLMDQNNNNIAGEDPADRFNGSFTLYGTNVNRRNAEPSAGAPIGTQDRVRIVFSSPIDVSTFTLADVTNFTGPGGPVVPTSITPDPTRPTTEFFVNFPPQGVAGNYQFTVGPNVNDQFGNPMDQNQNTITGEMPGDQFVATFTVDGFRTGIFQTPGIPMGPVSNIRLGFIRPVDTATLDLTDVVSFNGPGGAISVTSITPVAGSNGLQFDFNFAAQTALGFYQIVIGPNIQDIYGNGMDQNSNGIPFEVPADRFTGSFSLVGPRGNAGGAGFFKPGVTFLQVGFTQAMDATTFTAADIVMTGPNGVIPITGISPATGASTMFIVSFPIQGAHGAYSLLIGPDIRNTAGVQLDQNSNRIPGETPGDQFTMTFNITAPRITGSSPSGVVLGPVSKATVTFDQDMDGTTFTLADIVSFTGPNGSIPVNSVTQVNLRTFDVNFDPQNAPGPYSLVIGPNIHDTFGNPMNQNNNSIPGEDPGDRFTMTFTLNQFGPDPFGYVARMGTFENINLVLGAAGVVTVLDNVDDAFAAVDLGTNTFNYYGTIFTGNNRIFASTNGLITFGQGSTQNAASAGTLFQPYMAVLWRNWTTSDSTFPNGAPAGEVLSKLDDVNGDGTADRLIIEWSNVRNFISLTQNIPITFQAVLDLNTGPNASGFTFNYVNTNTLDPLVDSTSTVAIKDMFPSSQPRLSISPTNPSSPWVGASKALRFTAPPIGGTISGQKFNDFDRDGVKDAGEQALANWQVFIDLNQDGDLDAGEPTQLTDANGNYSFPNLTPGTYHVAEVVQPLWLQMRPGVGGAVVNGNFETGDFTGWSTIGRTSIQATFENVVPAEGTKQALITNQTGSASVANVETFLGVPAGTLTAIGGVNAVEGSAIKQTLFATAGSTISFDINFLTNETPMFPGRYDFAFLTATSATGARVADSLQYFDPVTGPTQFFRRTGRSTFTYTFPHTGTYTVGIGVMDAGGGGAFTDSGLLLDNVQLRGTVYPVTVGVRQTVGAMDFGNTRLVTGATSGVRGQYLNFTLGAGDQLPADQFTYNIDWDGDGTVDQVVNGANGLKVKHVYATTGNYTVRVTSTDAFGNVLGPMSIPVSITVVALQPDPGDPSLTALAIGGTVANDVILVMPNGSPGTVRVLLNGTLYGPFSPTGRVIVYAQAGNDLVNVSNSVAVPTMLFGDDGNDLLNGGNVRNILVGGAGLDLLAGGSARDVIIGGLGSDILTGEGGEDILVAGTTSHDQNEAALTAIAAEWSRTDRTYEQRVDALRIGGGLNGSSVLNAATVFDDAAIDLLLGGSGRDWFFGAASDLLADRASNEEVN